MGLLSRKSLRFGDGDAFDDRRGYRLASLAGKRCRDRNGGDLLNDVHSLVHLAELAVLGILGAIQSMCLLPRANKKLAAVGIGSGISHGHNPRVILMLGRQLILELVAGPTTTGTGRIAALNHQILDYPVKNNTIKKALLRQKDEAVHCLGRFLRKQLYCEGAHVGIDNRRIFLSGVYLHGRRRVPLFCVGVADGV